MSTELARIEPAADLANLTLDELTQAAIDEYRQAEFHLVGAFAHCVRLGEVMLAARQKVPDGQWIAWLSTVGVAHYELASRFMRLAAYRDKLPREAFEAFRASDGRTIGPSMNRALQYLRGLPDVYPRRGIQKYSEETRREARRLRSSGMTFPAIAELLNVGQTTVRCWCSPEVNRRRVEARRRYKSEQTAAKRALSKQRKREEGAALATAAGGSTADAYSLVRRLLVAVDKALADDPASDVRMALDLALRHASKTEDHLVQALRASRVEATP